MNYEITNFPIKTSKKKARAARKFFQYMFRVSLNPEIQILIEKFLFSAVKALKSDHPEYEFFESQHNDVFQCILVTLC